MIEILHQCQTIFQFDSLSSRVLEIWENLGEKKYADWFGSENLVGHWRLWFYNAGPPGTPCTNNITEIFNRMSLKKQLNKGFKETLQQALAPNGYVQRTLVHIDSHNTLDNLVILPPHLTQLGMVGFCSIPDMVIKKACKILLPTVTNIEENNNNMLTIGDCPNIK